MSLLERAERAFETWGRLVVRHPWPIIALSLLFPLLLTAQVRGLRVNNSQEAMLRPGDPTLVELQEFRARFPRENIVLLAIEHPDVFDAAFLERLRSFHEALEQRLPHLEEVKSLVNARITYGTRDELVVESLADDWPATAAGLRAFRERILANPLYRGVLVSADGRYTSVAAVRQRLQAGAPDLLEGFDAEAVPAAPADSLLDQQQSREFAAAVHEIAADYEAPDFAIHVAGIPILGAKLGQVMQRDMLVFSSLSILVIGGLLFALFRRWSCVVLPLGLVLLSAGSTLGLMRLAGAPLSLITEILPSFLLVVGVCDAIHLLVIFHQRLDAAGSPSDAIVGALAQAGLPVLLTSVTTALGLSSFATANLAPLMHMGIFAPAGVVIAFLLSVTLLPALLAVIPERGLRAGAPRLGPAGSLLGRIGDLGTRHPAPVLAVSAVVVLGGLLGAVQLRVQFDAVSWFPEHDPMRRATHIVDEALGGSTGLEILVDSGRDEAFLEPDLLTAVDRLEQRIRAVRTGEVAVQTATSLSSIVKEIHQALNENRPEAYAVPRSRDLVAQELLLFENSGSGDLAKVADSRLSLARLSLRAPHAEATRYLDFLEQVDEQIAATLGPDVEVTTTGSMILLARTAINAATSMVRSYLLALVAITALIVLVIGNLRLGLVAMIPNLTPILLTLGLMYWAGIPLDTMSLLIGSLVLGLAVDDTIHFVHGFRRHMLATGDTRAAIRETLTTTGVAMLATSAILCAGFLVYGLSDLSNIRTFGLLVAFATVVAFLADVLLGAALVTLAVRRPLRSMAPGRPWWTVHADGSVCSTPATKEEP